MWGSAVKVGPHTSKRGGLSMAKIEILARISGSRDGVEWPAVGETLSVPADEAADLVRLGFARLVEAKAEKAPVERAVAPKAETRKQG